MPAKEPFLEDKEYRSRCIQALTKYYGTFGTPRNGREPRTLQGYANTMGVYLDDTIEVMRQLGVGMPSYKKTAKGYLKKIKKAS